jgi:hypothetical protein
MTSQYARTDILQKVFDALQSDLKKAPVLAKVLAAPDFSVAIRSAGETEDSFECRVEIQSSKGSLSEEDAEALSDWVEARFEEIAIEQLGQDAGEDLALDLIFVEVWLNGKALT